jgi:hypothetical protein
MVESRASIDVQKGDTDLIAPRWIGLNLATGGGDEGELFFV